MGSQKRSRDQTQTKINHRSKKRFAGDTCSKARGGSSKDARKISSNVWVGKQKNYASAPLKISRNLEKIKGKTWKTTKTRNSIYEIQGVAQKFTHQTERRIAPKENRKKKQKVERGGGTKDQGSSKSSGQDCLQGLEANQNWRRQTPQKEGVDWKKTGVIRQR